MSRKENLFAASVVTLLGVAAYLLIPNQVSMEPVPGSMGFSRVGPATLPALAAWGLIATGFGWLAMETWRWRRQRVVATMGIPRAAVDARWRSPMSVWLGMVAYVGLTPLLGFTESSMLFGLCLALATAPARAKRKRRRFVIELLAGVVLFPVGLQFLFYRFLYVALPTGFISRSWIG